MTDIPNEALLVAAGRAVLAEFRYALATKDLPPSTVAALRQLEIALRAYAPGGNGSDSP